MKDWKIRFLTFKESLFEINHSLIFCNSIHCRKKDSYVLVCSKNRFASSANIIVFSKLEALGRSFTYIKNNSGPYVGSWGTPHVTFCPSALLSLFQKTSVTKIYLVGFSHYAKLLYKKMKPKDQANLETFYAKKIEQSDWLREFWGQNSRTRLLNYLK